MLIGELAKRSKLTKETIRHYEEIGLLRGIKILSNGYKNYPDRLVEDLKLIGLTKDLGFTLKEIKSLLSLLQKGQLTRSNLNQAIQKKIDEINQQMSSLNLIKERLNQELARTCSPQETLKIMTS